MAAPILATKLYIPRLRPKIVPRPRLTERLNAGLHTKLTLISAPAGFGKTTLVSEWVAACRQPVAWLSLDEGDNDPLRFLTYLIAALQTVTANSGGGVLRLLQSPQPPPPEAVLTALLNDLSALPDDTVLVLDDYHVINARAVDAGLAFLLEHLPPRLHLVIATREDPSLPLARLRSQAQLTELRVVDLSFTPDETAGFLNRVMGLNLAAQDISALGSRTEGWIAGLQLAALALQGTISTSGQQDVAAFIKSFTGSHHFVMDYLVEEVLNQQPASLQNFLLHTSVLERLCGPLCDAVLNGVSDPTAPSVSGQETLEFLARANLFIIPLDNERRWYRYHHLFADLLRQRLQRTSPRAQAEIHRSASAWYEANDLEIEAFQHAVAAGDIELAARLMEGKGMPLQFRGAITPVLNWLKTLPASVLDDRPSLWVMYASALSMTGQMNGVEEKLQAAEAALQGAGQDEKTRNLIGHIAAIRALLAATQNQIETIITQSQRALEYLHPGNLPVRTATIWKLGIAYHLKGERAAAGKAYSEAVAISQASGNTVINLSARIGLGNIQEMDNQLYLAAETYRAALQQGGGPPPAMACEAHLGLAYIYYEWDDLETADQHARQSLQLAQEMVSRDTSAFAEVFFARLNLARGNTAAADECLSRAFQFLRQHRFEHRLADVAAVQVLALLHQGKLTAAAQLAAEYRLPISQGRVLLAQGNPGAALALLEPYRQQVAAKGWADELLKVTLLQALALRAHGEKDQAVNRLGEALSLAKPGGFIRTFIDEGAAMAGLLAETAAAGIMPDYSAILLAVFEAQESKCAGKSSAPADQALSEPLSARELEVLRLIARGLSNRQISERLFLALSTVKGHNREIFAKLQAQRRSEAVARAQEMGLL